MTSNADPNITPNTVPERGQFALFAIYDAESTLMGELAYVLGKLRGARACALCDISHGWNPLGKSAWRAARCFHPELTWLHKNEQDAELWALTAGQLPVVVIRHDGGQQILVTREELEQIAGDYAAFESLLAAKLAGLTNPKKEISDEHHQEHHHRSICPFNLRRG